MDENASLTHGRARRKKQTAATADKKAARPDPRRHDEDPVGKVYDSRLMGRLGRYLLPYWWQATVSSISVTLKSLSDVSGPFLVMVGIDHYFPTGSAASHTETHGFGSAAWLTHHLSSDPTRGITQLAAIYLCLQICAYLFEFIQTYLMQWTGQKIMFDLRREIFRHMQRLHVGFSTPTRSAALSRASPPTSMPSTRCSRAEFSPSSTTFLRSPSWPS